MKKLFSFLFSLLFANMLAVAAPANVSRLGENIEARLAVKTSPTLQVVLDLEEANAYQRAQIEGLLSRLVAEVKGKRFNKLADVVFYLNSRLPNTGSEDSMLLKNAFAERRGEKPKENLDCDSRAILVKSVLEILGYPYGKVWLATLPNHAVLTDGRNYYDLISRQMEYYEGDDLALLHQITTDKQFKSLILANLATYHNSQAGSIFGRVDREKKRTAKNLFKKAVSLDPTNINALKNLLSFLKYDENDAKYKKQIVEVMVYNYLRNTGQAPQVTDAAVARVAKACRSVEEELIVLTQGDGKNALWAVRVLLQAGINPGGWFSLEMAKKSFMSGNYEAMQAHLNKAYALKGKNDYLQKAQLISLLGREMESLSQITQGRIAPEDTPALKRLAERSQVAAMVFLGYSISFDFLEIGDAFAKWKGCRAFMRGVNAADFPDMQNDFCK